MCRWLINKRYCGAKKNSGLVPLILKVIDSDRVFLFKISKLWQVALFGDKRNHGRFALGGISLKMPVSLTWRGFQSSF